MPDLLSCIPYASLKDEPDEESVAALQEIEDPWYLRRIRDVIETPWKFPDWRVENNRLYIHKRDYLLDPVTNNEYNWRFHTN